MKFQNIRNKEYIIKVGKLYYILKIKVRMALDFCTVTLEAGRMWSDPIKTLSENHFQTIIYT